VNTYTVTHPTAGYGGTITVKGFTLPFASRTYTGPVPDAVVAELQRIGYTVTPNAAQDAPTILGGTGVPTASAANGAFYFRLDGAAGAAIYQRRAGAWVAVA
jgi:hypothetical protein